MGVFSTLGSIAVKNIASSYIREGVRNITKNAPKPQPEIKKIIPAIKVDVPNSPQSQGGAIMDNPYQDMANKIASINKEKDLAKTSVLSSNYKAYRADEEYKKSQNGFFGGLFGDKSKSLFETQVVDEGANKFVGAKLPFKSQIAKSIDEYKYNAEKEVKSYANSINEFNSPGSRIEDNLKKQLGDKYTKFKESIAIESNYVDALRSDKELRKDIPTFARSLYSGLGFDYLTDKLTGGNVRALNRAADYLNTTGELEESGVSKFFGRLIGDAPVYAAASMFGAAAAGEGLISIGVTTNSAKIAQAGANVLKLQKTNPSLYAATFDSAFGTAAEYGVRKATGLDYTADDAIRSLILGAIVPKALGEITDTAVRSVKFGVNAISDAIKPKDFKILDRVISEGTANGGTSLKEIFESSRDTKLSNGSTIGDVLDNLPQTPSGIEFQGVDVGLALGDKGITISSPASKRLGAYIKEANSQIAKDSPYSNEIATTVSDIMTRVSQSKIHDESSIRRIIDEAEIKNGTKVSIKSPEIDSNDIVSDLLHSPTFDIEKFKNSKDIDEVFSAFTGKSRVSLSKIDETRTSIDVLNRGGAKRVEELAREQGIKFDWDKAVNSAGVTDKAYLHKILDQVESTTIGYNKFSQKIISEFRNKTKSKLNNIKSGDALDAVSTGKQRTSDIQAISKDISILTQRLKTAANASERKSIKEVIGKKNLQIANLRSTISKRDADRRALASLIKGEIESISKRGEFATVLKQSEIKAIKDAHKARIVGKTTIEQAEKVILSLSEKLYAASYKKLYNAIGRQIKKVNKEITSKKKPSKIDPYYVKLMNDVAENLSGQPNLEGLQSIKLKLDTFMREGRDIKIENHARIAKTANEDLVKIASELETQGKGRLEVAGYNTPELGIGRRKTLFENIQSFFSGNVQSQHAIDRLFGVGSHGANVFDVQPRKGLGSFLLKKNFVLNDLLPKYLKSIKGVSGDADSIKNKVTMWRLRNSGGNDYNLWNDMILARDSKGNYQFIAKMDSSILGEGEIRFQSLQIDDRQSILDSIYREFDNEFSNNKEFASFENTLRQHFDSIGDSIGDKMRRLAGKEFPKNSNHHPAVFRNKFSSSSIIDDNMNYNHFYKDTINDGFATKRKLPTEMVKINTDLYSTLSYHINSATYWDSVIEPLVRMEKLHSKLKSGKIDKELLSEDELFNMERFITQPHNAEGGVYLSPEADTFLRLHIGKIATQGGNLRAMSDADAFSTVSKFQEHVIPSLLGGWRTPLKQLSSLGDSAAYGGYKNASSGWKSMMDVDNWEEAIKSSGYLQDRLPPFIIDESAGKQSMTQGNKSKWTRAAEFRNEFLSKAVGGLIRTTDGAASGNAWFVGLSKYLDEAHPDIHKSGKSINIKEIKELLSPDEYSEAVAYADKFMSKIMGSNHVFDAGVSSQSILSKGVFFLGKTGLNRTMLMLEMGERVFSRNPSIGVGDRAVAASAIALNVAFNYALFNGIDKLYNKLQVKFGAKSQEDVDTFRSAFMGKEIKSPSFQDKLWKETVFIWNMMFINPGTGLDLSEGFSPLVQYGKKISSAPTLERKAEEAAYLMIRGVGGIHQDWINLGRSVVTAGGQIFDKNFDITNVANKEYDSAVSSIYSTVTKGKPSTLDMVKGESGGVKLPTGDKLDELVKTQKNVSASQKVLSQSKALSATTEKEFIDGFLSEHPDASKEAFIEYAKANKSSIYGMGITKSSELLSLYTKIETQKVKSTGQETSLLMGKPVEVIYDVKVKPLIDEGDYNGAIEEINRLISSGVIKNRSGAEKLVKLAQGHGNQ